MVLPFFVAYYRNGRLLKQKFILMFSYSKSILKLSKTNLLWLTSIVCMTLVLLYPNITFATVRDTGITYVVTSLIFLIPVAILIALSPKKWLFCSSVMFFAFLSMIDQGMIDLYGDYLLPGGIISTIKTNPQEASEFYQTNVGEILNLMPLLCLGILSCICYQKPKFTYKRWFAIGLLLLIPCCFVTYKIRLSYHNSITLRYYVHHRILNRTPYNVFYQSWNTHIDLKHRRQAEHMKDIDMGAQRQAIPPQKEIYVFGIGESLRYDNLSLNGQYNRTTTPRLEALDNLMLFDNYYSQACLTMFSVPQLVTRATPDNFELNFAERSIIEPFRECGFKVLTIVNSTNLLSYERYLSNGVDSLIIVPNIANGRNITSGDKTMVQVLDSLVNVHDKLFVMMEFMGNHSFFTNYEQEYEVYNPNSNNCASDMIRDSMMLINAYDNSILYTDYILASLIETINRPNTVSAFMFVSDHGEAIGNGGAGHGGNCSPIKCEYHVPYIFWWSEEYASFYPNKIRQAKANKKARINGDCMYYTLCDMADITLSEQYSQPTWSVLSERFAEHPRLVLVPDGKTCIQVE